jgi:hypothetical protein
LPDQKADVIVSGQAALCHSPLRSEDPVTVTKTFLSGAAALAVLAFGVGPVQAQEAPIPAGTWRFVPEQSEPIDAAVDQAVAHLNFLIRGVARSRLRNANKPVDRIVIQYPDDDVYISLRADEPPTISPKSGEFAPYTRADGEVVRVKTELSDGVITQFFDSDDGQKEHVYRLLPDGAMALEVTVFSERLRAPFQYTWIYRN